MPQPIDFKRIAAHGEPFPHFKVDKAVDAKLFRQMKADWPEELFEGKNVKMGGRMSFNQKSKDLRVLMDRSPAWKKFFDFINSEEFVFSVIDLYRPWIDDDHCLLDYDRLSFSPEFREDNPDHVLSVDYGLTRATSGYSCRVHHDQEFRLAALLLFMNERTEFGGTGGTFNVHHLEEKLPLEESVRFPKKGVGLTDVVEPAENRMVSFLNTRQAYHSVPEMEGATGWRNFLYLGINAGNKGSVAWRQPATMAAS